MSDFPERWLKIIDSLKLIRSANDEQRSRNISQNVLSVMTVVISKRARRQD